MQQPDNYFHQYNLPRLAKKENKLTDSLVDRVVIVVGDEAEAPVLASGLVSDEVNLCNVSERAECFPDLVFCRVVLNAANKHFLDGLLRF